MLTQYKVTRFIVTSILVAILSFGLNFLGEAFGIEWLRKAGLLLFVAAFACAFIGSFTLVAVVVRDLFKN
jgi:hypothetical protein